MSTWVYIRWCEAALEAARLEVQPIKQIEKILQLIEDGKEDHDEKYMSLKLNSAYISQETFRVNDIPYVSNQGFNLKAKILKVFIILFKMSAQKPFKYSYFETFVESISGTGGVPPIFWKKGLKSTLNFTSFHNS